MSKWTDAGHIEPTGALFSPVFTPDENGNLSLAGQRFIQQMTEWVLEEMEANENAKCTVYIDKRPVHE